MSTTNKIDLLLFVVIFGIFLVAMAWVGSTSMLTDQEPWEVAVALPIWAWLGNHISFGGWLLTITAAGLLVGVRLSTGKALIVGSVILAVFFVVDLRVGESHASLALGGFLGIMIMVGVIPGGIFRSWRSAQAVRRLRGV